MALSFSTSLNLVPTGNIGQTPSLQETLTGELLKDSDKLQLKPNRMSQDVWALLQEYTVEGGLLDLGEDIAVVAKLIQELFEDAEGLSRKEQLDLVMRMVRERGRLKESYLKVQEARRNVITLDMFVVFLGRVFDVLQQRIKDPELLRAIGMDLTKVSGELKSRMNV